jgi:hypothetical protein
MERSEMRRQIGVGLGLLALAVLVVWQVAGSPRNAAVAQTGLAAVQTPRPGEPRLQGIELAVLGHVYSSILDGRPLRTPEALAGGLGKDVPTVRAALEALAGKGVLTLDASGAVVLVPPFSATPSRHEVTLSDGRRLYGCCAWHALAIPAICGNFDATLRSKTPQFERIVTVQFTHGRMAAVSPLGAVLWIPRGAGASADGCRRIFLFTSPPELTLWQGENPTARRGFSPALTQAKRTATERLSGRVQAALDALGGLRA